VAISRPAPAARQSDRGRSGRGDEAVEVDVRAAERALDDMVNFETATPTARLAAPASWAPYLAPDQLPHSIRDAAARALCLSGLRQAQSSARHRVRLSLRRIVSEDQGYGGCRRIASATFRAVCSGEVTEGHRYFAGP